LYILAKSLKGFHIGPVYEYKVKKGDNMKFLLALMVVCSTSAFSAEIENGRFEIETNDRTEIMRSACSSYIDGKIVGVGNAKDETFSYVHEFEVPKNTDLSSDSFTVNKKVGVISAKGFCAPQHLLNSLEMIYTKTINKVSISYKYRCNRKEMIKTVSCNRI
jgi:hypothetical protein